MKRIVSLLIVFSLMLSLSVSAHAGSITYDGDSGDFIFEPGSEYSPTDLFTDLKEVMPGDDLTQIITIRNKASKDVKIKLYLRSHGAQEGSEEFLSMLHMTVRVCDDNTMGYMFDAAASESAQLTDWVYLGTLYSGGEVNVEVRLQVPVEMSNEHQDQIAYFLDWEFRIEEYPVDPDDPKPPQTGDETNLPLLTVALAVSACAIILLPIFKKKRREDNE